MKKRLTTYGIKSQGLELKDLDSENRKVVMYLSKFNVRDSDDDIIRRGAFKKSLNERGPESTSNRKIAFLRYHNWEMPIGKFTSLEEDEVGLVGIAQLGKSTIAEDAWADYEEGIIKEHSIGFKYIADKMRYVDDDSKESKPYYEINELALYEGSAVTFGANPYTEVVDIMKGENRNDVAEKLLQEHDKVVKSLRNGQGSDERLHNMEMRLKFLNSRMFELATKESFEKHSLRDEPLNEKGFDWNKFVNNF